MERVFLTNRTYKGRVCIAIDASLTELRHNKTSHTFCNILNDKLITTTKFTADSFVSYVKTKNQLKKKKKIQSVYSAGDEEFGQLHHIYFMIN